MQSRTYRRVLAPIAGTAALGLLLAGCTTSDTSGQSQSQSGPATVTIYGPQSGTEGSQLAASWKAWAAQNKITIKFTGDQSFTTNIATKIQGNDLPDIAFFPQPGLFSSAVASGKVVPLSSAVESSVKQNYSTDWQNYASSNGKLYGVPVDASVKGYIWYSPAEFKKYSITVPKTWDELLAATATLQSKTGKAPWCAGFSSGSASGWPGADWLSDVVIRSQGASVYDDWTKGTTKFSDPKIQSSFDLLGKILKDPKYVNAGFGNVASINSTAFGDVAIKMADGSCQLTHQATFLKGSFTTTKTKAGTAPTVGPDGDIWAFMMPPMAAGDKQAITGGGDFAAAFNNNAATQKVLEYLASPEWANSLISVKDGSFLSPNQGVDPTKEADPLLRSAIETLKDPNTVFRFGAGDVVPNAVGVAFWKGMVDWVNGTSAPAAATKIDAAWSN